MKVNSKPSLKGLWCTLSVVAATSAILTACGGGGGGHGGSVLYYPYEDLYGNVCITYQATPGCTFLRTTGARITVTEDPYYNYYGGGSNDLDYVVFNSSGTYADVYNYKGVYLYSQSVSSFSGYIGTGTIGLGVTGAFWEDVRNGTYWWGKNGVLYSANSFDWNYGQAINNKGARNAADTDLVALTSDANQALVKAGAAKLVDAYNMEPGRAQAVARTFNRWGVTAQARGFTTGADMETTFKDGMGVDYKSAIAAVVALRDKGDTSLMVDLTERSAAANGMTQTDVKRMWTEQYGKALASWGYNIKDYNW